MVEYDLTFHCEEVSCVFVLTAWLFRSFARSGCLVHRFALAFATVNDQQSTGLLQPWSLSVTAKIQRRRTCVACCLPLSGWVEAASEQHSSSSGSNGNGNGKGRQGEERRVEREEAKESKGKGRLSQAAGSRQWQGASERTRVESEHKQKHW